MWSLKEAALFILAVRLCACFILKLDVSEIDDAADGQRSPVRVIEPTITLYENQNNINNKLPDELHIKLNDFAKEDVNNWITLFPTQLQEKQFYKQRSTTTHVSNRNKYGTFYRSYDRQYTAHVYRVKHLSNNAFHLYGDFCTRGVRLLFQPDEHHNGNLRHTVTITKCEDFDYDAKYNFEKDGNGELKIEQNADTRDKLKNFVAYDKEKSNNYKEMEIHGPYPEIRNLKDWLHDDSTEPYISNSESDEDDGAEETISKPRAKRQTATITVELFMVIDFAIYDWWDRLAKDLGQHTDTVTLIETHFGYVFREIDLRLQNLKEQDYTIKAALAGTYVARRESESNWTLGSTLEVDATSPRIMVNSSEALEKFQSWIDTNIDLPHFDHAILFTGTNLSYAGSAGNTGLAFGSSMCLNISKSSIVEDTFDTRTVTFATQQIVRSLGSRDDMDNNDCLEFFNYIMAQKFKLPIRSFASNKWKFSSCSEQYVKMYLHELDVAGMNCLKETRVSQPNPDRPASVNEKPVGFVYSPKEQCQHKFGATSDVCRVAIGTRYSKICVGLLCVVPETGVCDYIFPADGTTCGYNKYCWHGNCDEFEDGEDVSDTCAYGNDPTVNCNEMIMNDMAVCYNETVRFACCQSCEKIMIDFPGCEFGDRSGQCQISKCIAGNKTLTSHTCCLTCVDGPTPYVPPLERLLFDTSTVSVFRTTDVTTPSTIFPSILTRATTHTLLSNVGENVETPITTNTIISSPNDTVTSIGDTGIRSKTMTAEQMTSSASSASSASTTAADITEYSVTTLKTESLTDVTDPSLTAPHVSSTPSTYNLDKQTTIELTRYTNPTSAMSKPSGKCVCLPETIITETVATTADPQYLEAPASTLAPQHRSTTADTRPTPQTNTDRPLYIAVSRIMRQCQRYTRSVVHDDLNLLYTSVTSRLRYYGGEFEHEVESQKEANENGSSETLDINRTLKPLWVTQYLRIMRHLDLNIRDMRYKVLATLNRHAQTNA